MFQISELGVVDGAQRVVDLGDFQYDNVTVAASFKAARSLGGAQFMAPVSSIPACMPANKLKLALAP